MRTISYTALFVICCSVSVVLTAAARDEQGARRTDRSAARRSEQIVVLSSEGVVWSASAVGRRTVSGTWNCLMVKILMDRGQRLENTNMLHMAVWKPDEGRPYFGNFPPPWPVPAMEEQGSKWIVCLGDVDAELHYAWESRLERLPVLQVWPYSERMAKDYELVDRHIKQGEDLESLLSILQEEETFGREFAIYAGYVIFEIGSEESVDMKRRCATLLYGKDLPTALRELLVLPVWDYVRSQYEMSPKEVEVCLDACLGIAMDPSFSQMTTARWVEDTLLYLLDKHGGVQLIDHDRYDVKKILESLRSRKGEKAERLIEILEKL